MNTVTVPDPADMDRGRTLHGVMDGLAELAAGPVAAALKAATGGRHDVAVTRYRPLRPNTPAVWHERRPGRIDLADTGYDVTELYVAVILALNHRDGETEGAHLEEAIDAAQTVYRRKLRERGALHYVHQARLVNVEPPTPTVINDVPLLTSGLVIRVRIDAPNR